MAHNLADIRYNIEKANRTDRKVQNLASYIDEELLKSIHRRMEKNKASGVDKMTKEEYEVNLDDNLKKAGCPHEERFVQTESYPKGVYPQGWEQKDEAAGDILL